jgi:hypothetical protein
MPNSIQIPFKKNPAYKNVNSSTYKDYSYTLIIKPFSYITKEDTKYTCKLS